MTRDGSQITLRPEFLMNYQRRLSAVLLLILFSLSLKAQTPQAPPIPGVDTTALNARIEKAEASARAAGATTNDRRAAARAYLERANLYRNAAVPTLYKFALGDYRRVLRYEPSNAEAREKMDEIVSIYQSMRRPVPTNGLEDEGTAAEGTTAGGIFANMAPRAAAAAQTPQRVRFRRGSSSAVLKGAIVLGSADEYVIGARAGQRLTLRITSLEKNAVFDLYKTHAGEPSEIVMEKKNWSGVLEEDGDYLIRVGSERGNTAYTLRVTIR
jgi:hypothetical protein